MERSPEIIQVRESLPSILKQGSCSSAALPLESAVLTEEIVALECAVLTEEMVGMRLGGRVSAARAPQAPDVRWRLLRGT